MDDASGIDSREGAQRAPAIPAQAPGEASAIAACSPVTRDKAPHLANICSHMLQRFFEANFV